MNNPYFNVPEEDVITTTVISIENVDGSYTLYDRGIVSDSMSLSRILCSSGLNFGETNSSKFEFQMYDIPDITNRFIKVIRRQKYNDSVVDAPVFTGYVDSFKSEIDSAVKNIIAYDIWYFKKDLNIAGWIDEFLKDYRDDYLRYGKESQYYNGVTLSQLQEHLFTYFNIPYETLDNDFIVIPPLTAFGQSSIAISTALDGLKSTILNFNTLGEIVFAINEVNASFGYIDPDGNYVHKKLQNTFDRLHPARWNLDTNDIDISGTDIDFNNIIPSIDMVKYTDSSGETLTMGDTNGNVIYELSSNPLLAYHTTAFSNQWELSTLWIYDYQQRLYNIYTEITNITYYVGSIPLKLSSPPTDEGISLGDSISVYLGENITGIMYAMQLDYSGSQLYDETISTVANTASADMSITTSSPPVSSEGGSFDYVKVADKLKTSRKISLSTAVTSSGKEFDGTKDINIEVNSLKEAYLEWGGKNHTNSFGPIDGAMVPVLGANRLAFLPASAVNIQYSRDNGSSWVDYSTNDNDKVSLFSGISPRNSYKIGQSNTTGIDKSSYQLRVIIDAEIATVYTELNKFLIYCSTNGSSGCWCTIEGRNWENVNKGIDKWDTFADRVNIAGWSGYNIVNTPKFITYRAGGNSKYYKEIRFTFGVTSHPSTASSYGLSISNIMGFGGVGWLTPSNLAGKGTLYSYDANQNAIFPKGIYAESLYENDEALSDKYSPIIKFVKVNLGSHTFKANTGSNNISVDVSASIPDGYTLVAVIPMGTGNNNLYYYWMGVISSTTIQYQCRNVSTSAQTGTQLCQIICVKQ